MCNDARIVFDVEEGTYGRIGEPTEAALNVLVEKLGVPGKLSFSAARVTVSCSFAVCLLCLWCVFVVCVRGCVLYFYVCFMCVV